MQVGGLVPKQDLTRVGTAAFPDVPGVWCGGTKGTFSKQRGCAFSTPIPRAPPSSQQCRDCAAPTSQVGVWGHTEFEAASRRVPHASATSAGRGPDWCCVGWWRDSGGSDMGPNPTGLLGQWHCYGQRPDGVSPGSMTGSSSAGRHARAATGAGVQLSAESVNGEACAARYFPGVWKMSPILQVHYLVLNPAKTEAQRKIVESTGTFGGPAGSRLSGKKRLGLGQTLGVTPGPAPYTAL